jgi:hypothetical protein
MRPSIGGNPSPGTLAFNRGLEESAKLHKPSRKGARTDDLHLWQTAGYRAHLLESNPAEILQRTQESRQAAVQA